MIQTTIATVLSRAGQFTETGPLTFDTKETFYHVHVADKGWVGEIDREASYQDRHVVSRWVFTQPYAHIFSKGGALLVASKFGGRVYRMTTTGKLQPVNVKTAPRGVGFPEGR